MTNYKIYITQPDDMFFKLESSNEVCFPKSMQGALFYHLAKIQNVVHYKLTFAYLNE